jgi:hypothetical protein
MPGRGSRVVSAPSFPVTLEAFSARLREPFEPGAPVYARRESTTASRLVPWTWVTSRTPRTWRSWSAGTFRGPGDGAAPGAGWGQAVDIAVWNRRARTPCREFHQARRDRKSGRRARSAALDRIRRTIEGSASPPCHRCTGHGESGEGTRPHGRFRGPSAMDCDHPTADKVRRLGAVSACRGRGRAAAPAVGGGRDGRVEERIRLLRVSYKSLTIRSLIARSRKGRQGHPSADQRWSTRS